MNFYLKVLHSENELQIIELVRQIYLVGRSENCHVKIDSSPHSYISRCHLTLVLGRDNQRFFYTAYDGNLMARKTSTSGLFINKNKLQVNGQQLASGDVITFVDVEKTIYPYLEYIEESELIVDIPTETHDFKN